MLSQKIFEEEIRNKILKQNNENWLICKEALSFDPNDKSKEGVEVFGDEYLLFSKNKNKLIAYFKNYGKNNYIAYIKIKEKTNDPLFSDVEFKEEDNGWISIVLKTENRNANYLSIFELAEKEQDEYDNLSIKHTNKDLTEYSNFNNKSPKNIILYGPPGTGKTFSFKKLISIIENDDSLDLLKGDYKEDKDKFNLVEKEKRFKFITFHQSYSYEDFIEGFRPTLDDSNNNKVKIKLQDGLFKEICKSASETPNKSFYLIIDEINRGNISKIFGELITLLEEDKREELSVLLPYSKDTFTIPKNLFIIGTMNTADKSIALLDVALRRRFIFVEMFPNLDLIEDTISRRIVSKINSIISENRTKDLQIGHAYFMQGKEKEFVFKYQIKPLLEEYFYGENLKEVLKNDTEILDILGIN